MKGKWDYSKPAPKYGAAASYELAAQFLDGHCAVVEDWGCGGAEAKKYFKESRYVGVDGSAGYADVVADLRVHKAACQGILIRHVLEHNYDWLSVLLNAVGARPDRIAVVLFLKPTEWTTVGSVNPDGVPNLHVSFRGLARALMDGGYSWSIAVTERDDGTPHKAEYCYLAQRVQ